MRIRTSGRTARRERAGPVGRGSGGAHPAGFGMLAVLAALIWSAPAQQSAGPVDSPVPVASRTSLAPSQGDPGIPEPVIPQPPPVSAPDPVQAPVVQPQTAVVSPASPPVRVVAPDPTPEQASAPPALYPPELAGPGLVPPGMTGPGGTTPLSGQGNAGLSASQPALSAPIEQPQPGAPEPGFPTFAQPGAPEPGFAPWAQSGASQPGLEPVDPAQAPSACPENVAPGEILPPSIWSVCPGVQPPGWSFPPFLPYYPPNQPFVLAPGAFQIQIPWVTGFRTDHAQQTLALSGLNLGSVTEEPSTSPPGTVLRTDPPFGSAVEFGHAVNLVVAGP
jgi:PASTA domain